MDDQVFGWDDTGRVTEDAQFEALPEGEYDYEVRDVKFDRYNKRNESSAIPSGCPMAVVQLWCTNPNAKGTTFERLYLYGGGLGRITTFFKSCGLIEVDAPADAPMPASFKQMFDRSVTTTGRCKLTVRTYKDKDNNEQKSNNIRFHMPEPKPRPQTQPQAGGWGGSW